MESLEQRVKRHEGFRAHPYLCTQNALTVGWGRNLTANGITKDEAVFMLQNDLARCERDYFRLLKKVRKNCNEARREVLIEMIFQLGYMGVLGFKNMLGAIAANDFERASKEMLNSRWHNQTTERCLELSEVMKHGK